MKQEHSRHLLWARSVGESSCTPGTSLQCHNSYVHCLPLEEGSPQTRSKLTRTTVERLASSHLYPAHQALNHLILPISSLLSLAHSFDWPHRCNDYLRLYIYRQFMSDHSLAGLKLGPWLPVNNGWLQLLLYPPASTYRWSVSHRDGADTSAEAPC